MQKKYSFKLGYYLLFLLLLVALPVMIWAVVNFEYDKRVSVENTKHKFIQLIQSVSKELETERVQMQRDLMVLAQALAAQHLKPSASWQNLAAAYGKRHPYTAAIIVCDPEGNSVYCQPSTTRKINYADRRYFIRATQTKKPTSSNLLQGRISQKSLIAFAYPILNPDKRVEGVLITGLDLEWVKQGQRLSNLPDGTILRLLDKNGETVFRHPDNHGIRFNELSKEVFFSLKKKPDTVFASEYVDKDGVSYVCAIERLLSFPDPTYLALAIPKSNLYGPANNEARQHALFFLILFSGVGVIVWHFTRTKILLPIEGLVDHFRDIASGDLSSQTEIDNRCEELNHLQTHFNFMARALEQRELAMLADKKHIHSLNRLYSVISDFNRLVLTAKDRETLLKTACRIASEKGQFFLVWVGKENEETGYLEPIAWSGHGSKYIDKSMELMRNGEQEPVGSCLRNGDKLFCNDVENSVYSVAWRNNALKHGIRSLAVCPISIMNKNDGALVFCCDETAFFDNEEMNLLEVLADDTSLGLEYCHKDEKLKVLGYYDALTGLPNRILFRDRLQQGIARSNQFGKKLAVVEFRIDKLDQIIAAHGIENRDLVVKEVAGYLEKHLSECDTLARTSPSRFAMILENVGEGSEVFERFKRLFAAFPDSSILSERNIFVTAKAGIALAPRDGDNFYILLQNASTALESVMTSPINEFTLFKPEMHTKAQKRFAIENELRLAISRNELYLEYQPIVDAKTGKIVVAEALMRWQNGKLGKVSPLEFIGVAEETGMIVPIGDWLLKSICRDIEKIQKKQSSPLKFAMNLSIKQLCDDMFIERTKDILSSLGKSAKELGLIIELTETQLMENIDITLDKLKELRNMGFELSIDDFGTGYSSLNYLKKLPVNSLKIDQSFVRGVFSNKQDLAIVKSTLLLAHDLGLKVVAEGVETERVATLLQSFGCDRIQGNFFGKPGNMEALINR